MYLLLVRGPILWCIEVDDGERGERNGSEYEDERGRFEAFKLKSGGRCS